MSNLKRKKLDKAASAGLFCDKEFILCAYKVSYFLSLIAISSLVAGCAGPEEKFGRGLNNSLEFTRLGEVQRSMEQAAIFNAPGVGGMTTGFFHGIDRSVERTGAGFTKC